jgi:hypothetical protein
MRSWHLVSNYGHHVGQTALIDDRRQASPLKMLALRIEGVWQRHCTDVPACHIGTTRAGVSFDSGKAVDEDSRAWHRKSAINVERLGCISVLIARNEPQIINSNDQRLDTNDH